MTTRQERVSELLKREVSDILRREVKDPRLGFVTVTDAEVSKDLRHARIYVSVYGDEKETEESLAAMKSAAGYVRGEFGKRVVLKVLPEIVFELDRSVEHGTRIFELLQQVKRDDEA